jgi:hypothetical protein
MRRGVEKAARVIELANAHRVTSRSEVWGLAPTACALHQTR